MAYTLLDSAYEIHYSPANFAEGAIAPKKAGLLRRIGRKAKGAALIARRGIGRAAGATGRGLKKVGTYVAKKPLRSAAIGSAIYGAGKGGYMSGKEAYDGGARGSKLIQPVIKGARDHAVGSAKATKNFLTLGI